MNILSFDVTGKVASIALKTTSSYHDFIQDCHFSSEATKFLIPSTQAILEKARIKFTDLNVIGTLKGPGSFTGIRAGLAALLGYSLALSSIKVIAVSKFHLLKSIPALPDLPIVCDTFNNQYYFFHNEEIQILSKDNSLLSGPLITDCQEIFREDSHYINPSHTSKYLIDLVEKKSLEGDDQFFHQPIEPFYFQTPIYKKYQAPSF